MWSVVLIIMLCTILLEGKVYQTGYGYIGPVCAVVDGILFLHGVAKRNLDLDEVELFRAYQRDLSNFKKSQLTGFLSMDAPLVPYFCGGYDDSVEIVLDQCIVRNNHVYIDDKLIRPLTNLEKQKIETTTMRRAAANIRIKRTRRELKEPGLTSRNEISDLIHRFLNVNSTVTSRFLPVVSQSPLFSMDGNSTNVISLIANESKGTSPTKNKLLTKTSPRREAKKLSANTFPNKIDSLYQAMFITRSTKRFSQKMSTPGIKSFTTATSQPISPQHIYQIKKPTRSKQPFTKRNDRIPLIPGKKDRGIVLSPVILRMISHALANNELFGTATNIPLEELDKDMGITTNIQQSSSSHLNFMDLQPPSHTNSPIPQPLYVPSTNDIKYSTSLELPDEICMAHLTANHI